MGAIAVLDVGKTNAKLALVSRDGELLAEARRANATLPGPPYPQLDAEGIFAWAVDGLARLAAHHEIDAIVPVAHGACAALVDRDGLVLPVLDYEFAGVEELDLEYEPRARDFARTLSPRLPAGLNLGRQLFWLERRFPRELARATHLLLWPQYFAWRLCGARVAEVTSLGCHTDLWQPRERAPSRLLRESGWEKLLPPLVPAWARVGAGPGGAAVLAGIHDSNASYLVHRVAREQPFAVVSTGTWFVCMAHGAPLERLDEARDMLANVDAFAEPVPTARFMGGREFEARAAADPAEAVRHVARETARCLEALGAKGELIVEGPFAQNTAFLRALAQLRPGPRVLASDDSTGSAGGAAALVRLSCES
jgi:sugar (pentulose or hexulose) kinase